MKYYTTCITTMLCNLLCLPASYATDNNERQEVLSSFVGANMDIAYKDGKLTPKGKIPIRWDQHFSSSIFYSAQQNIALGSVYRDDSSFLVNIQDETRFGIGMLTYENNILNSEWSYSVGIEFEQLRIKAKDRGYYFNRPDIKDEFHPLELNRIITINRVNIPLQFNYYSEQWGHIFSLTLSPSSQLELKQDLYLPEYSSQLHVNKSKKNQKATWALGYEGIFKGIPFIAPGWGIHFEELPLEYESLVVSGQVGGTPIMKETITNDTQTMNLDFKIYRNRKVQSRLKEYIGYRYTVMRDTKIKNSKDSNNAVVIGIESRF